MKPTDKPAPTLLEQLALWAPSLCLIHCLALPLLVGALPLIGMSFLLDKNTEHIITICAVSLCLFAIVPGYLQHKQKIVLYKLIAGIILMSLGATLENYGKVWETVVMISGSFFLVMANLKNRKLYCCGNTCHSHEGEIAVEPILLDGLRGQAQSDHDLQTAAHSHHCHDDHN
jgi:hypothetical protein